MLQPRLIPSARLLRWNLPSQPRHIRLTVVVVRSHPSYTPLSSRPFHTSRARRTTADDNLLTGDPLPSPKRLNENVQEDKPRAEHAVISVFDLFSIGVGPSSSHTVGPMRAGKIFVQDLKQLGILKDVTKLKIGLFGSLAATGKGHMTPQAVLLGLEGSDPETIEPSTIQPRYQSILQTHHLSLAGEQTIVYDQDKDMLWRNEPLPTHPNGMRFSVFNKEGDLLAVNEYFSVGGGFVVNDQTKIDENLYYRGVNKEDVSPARREQTHGVANGLSLPAPGQETDETAAGAKANRNQAKQPPFLFRDGAGLLAMTKKYNLTIAQLVWENERAERSSEEISEGLMKLWNTMDQSIAEGVASKEERLPGGLGVRRRAPGLYRRLFKGFYPSLSPSSPTSPALPAADDPSKPLSLSSGFNSSPSPGAAVRLPSGSIKRTPLVVGSFDHELSPIPHKKAVFPGIDFLSCYAIAVNEVNAAGSRIVTAPTNGAAGVIPAVLKYVVEFISDDPEGDIKTFLLTAAAIGMCIKRSASISAAEGGCMAEVGSASSMSSAAFCAIMGGTPEQILQAAEIALEHSLGLTCDPHEGLVQVPCIERNAVGAVKAVVSAQLALSGDGRHSVSLDEAIEAMRVTARDMHTHYKETSMSGLAVS